MSEKYKGCITETYYDEEMKCEVTVILDTSGSLSPHRRHADEYAKSRGFHDIIHFEGYLYANGLFNDQRSGYDVDVLNLHS